MLENRTLEGYECRTESMFKIADELGIDYVRGESNKELDRIYRDLAPVFKGEDTLPIGTGKTGRLRQASYHKLYNFARQQYNIEVPDWSPIQAKRHSNKAKKEDRTIALLSSFLSELDQGEIKQDEFIGAIRGIVASHKLNQND
ncbi:hypothetical protein ACOJQI_20855 [Bacillus salacetis]|uniref:hypothetical protein n=1 Tax=Bacillus salacetis TaxID=2315464 RepID=UPI003B9DE92E